MASPESPQTSLPSEEKYPSVHLLLLITGSVAAIKTGLLLDQLSTERCNIRIAATKAAFHFLRRAQPSKTGIPFQSIITDEQEWSEWQAMNDAVVHIELRRWADLVVIAPLNANTLAKVATGLCDNLVSSVMRAWEVKQKPVILCPAMNTAMWTHPITAKQLNQLAEWYCDPDARSCTSCTNMIKTSFPVGDSCASPSRAVVKESAETNGREAEDSATTAINTSSSSAAVTAGAVAAATARGPPLPVTLRESMYQVVGPESKRLACGDIGIGGMASVEEIALHIRHTMKLIRDEKRRCFQEAPVRREAEAGGTQPVAHPPQETH
ncbi:phosphopantothenoylcysteine decarboxylase [Leishmania donovani]|uniref:Phosphopantothenoylcysteine_decarboxylase_-_putative n=3 Tax=Leishmania donovani species complex TaxID=38574 RepID=A0A6L0XVI5_LEIIN|nr:conserved hypothetical protein [Leishmania infantum JPCM5]XP_003862868.1 hypothetical protein, conserved [Leishmania donovani]CAC9513487.1 phosphopantothenoylcysteine_decarboxylase_-_putative [Leishmania infantum]AYU80954.1 phosphopantothenoylcysteine decarboxylase, putative [Leishmania donovani]CAJ1990940.1 phosphopantothenoylcysteine decarboxylase [Leishmania donovani]CAM70052.1 conserved hypothetical protein [Leishmania infantum JPCM5]CBZ36176.1 hypothetical protein, conserved [Leishman|eukprot:XP_001467002.1 conserved hypothetical protein [Leishmania infantum JPCM5]